MRATTCGLATAAEIPACLALLPETRDKAAHWLIARRGGAFVGAAAVVWREAADPGGFPLWIRTPAEHRREGVGRALLAAAEDLVRAETNGLWSMDPVPDASDAAQFMLSTGFAPTVRELRFQADIARMLDNLSGIIGRARARGGVPDFEIVGLASAPLEPLAWLLSRSLGGGPLATMDGARRRLGRRDGDDRDRSLVAIRDGNIAGVLLWRVDAGIAVIDAKVVAEAWRGSWVNLLMMATALEQGLSEGLSQLRFHCLETVRDTMTLARRAEARTVLSQALYRRPIAA